MTSDAERYLDWTVVLQVEGQRMPDFYDVEAPTAGAALSVVLARRREDMGNPPQVQGLYVLPVKPVSPPAVEEPAPQLGLWERVRSWLPWTEDIQKIDMSPPVKVDREAEGADLELVE